MAMGLWNVGYYLACILPATRSYVALQPTQGPEIEFDQKADQKTDELGQRHASDLVRSGRGRTGPFIRCRHINIGAFDSCGHRKERVEECQYFGHDRAWCCLPVSATVLGVVTKIGSQAPALSTPSQAEDCSCRLCIGVLVFQYVDYSLEIRGVVANLT